MIISALFEGREHEVWRNRDLVNPGGLQGNIAHKHAQTHMHIHAYRTITNRKTYTSEHTHEPTNSQRNYSLVLAALPLVMFFCCYKGTGLCQTYQTNVFKHSLNPSWFCLAFYPIRLKQT